MITCNHCQGTGFLNVDQLPDWAVVGMDGFHEEVLSWIAEQDAILRRFGGCSCHQFPPCDYCLAKHEVSVCNCCGDGDGWYGTPGQHYGPNDPQGPRGPYASNGGLCRCH